VEECALLLTDVDEGGLDSREHSLDPPQVDVAHRAPVVGTVHQQFDQPIVFQDSNAGFPLASVDQDFTLQMRPQTPLETTDRKRKRARRACPPLDEEHAARARRCWA
jgi:hypothetical protein